MNSKKCPFCAEDIQLEAIKCRHCGEFLDKKRRQNEERPWYFRDTIIVTMHLFVLFLALPLVWLNPFYSRRMKIIVTVVVSAITWFTAQMLSNAATSLQTYYKVM